MRLGDLQRRRIVDAPRILSAALAVALALHAALLVWWCAELVQRTNAPVLSARELIPVLAIAAGGAALAIWLQPMRARCAIAVPVIAAACVLIGPGSVAVVALMMLSALVVGRTLLEWSAGAPTTVEPTAAPSATTCMLTGAAVWMAVIGATLRLPLHYATTYALVLAASLLLAPGRTRDGLAASWAWLTAKDSWSHSERVWLVLGACIAALYLVVVAKPEVGYDASTMHLQFAELVAHDHRWPFDVGRYAWAVMPMGADYAYLAAYLLDAERAARLVNLAFGTLLGATTYALIRRHASRDVALASVCLLASTPLWFLESGTLYVEFAWTAFLVASLLSTLLFLERGGWVHLAAAAFAFAGAMQCKVIGVFWIAPLAVALLYRVVRDRRALPMPLAIACVLALAIGMWPYANAWLRTGNPVFPFVNHVFRSPLFDASTPFNNAAWNASLTLSTPYDLVMASGRYLEGADGAAGTQWLLLFPLIAFGMLLRGTRLRWMLLALAVGFAAIVYKQQSYLRYLLPAFVLVAILGGWVLGDWIRSPGRGMALAATGTALVVANAFLMPAASWTNATLCVRCGFDAEARARYVMRYAPLRAVADYLGRNLPSARVGFFVLNAPAPSGYAGYSRAANWHDSEAFAPLVAAGSADDVAAIARRFGLTHAVFVDVPDGPLDRVLLAYRDAYTRPVVTIDNYVIAEIRRDAR